MKKPIRSLKRLMALMLATLMLIMSVAGCAPETPAVSDLPESSAAESSAEDNDTTTAGENTTTAPLGDGSSVTEDTTTTAFEGDDTDKTTATTKKPDGGNTTKPTGAAATTKASTTGSAVTEATTTPTTATTTKPKPVDPTNGYIQSQFFISTFKAMPHSAGSTLEDYVKITQLHKEAGINLIENAIMSRAEGLLAAQACEQVGVKFLAQNITADKGYSGMGANCPAFTEDTIQFVVDELKDYKYLEGYYTWDEVDKPNFEKCRTLNDLFKKYDRSSIAFSIVLPSYGQYKWQTPDGNWENSYYAQYVNEYVEVVDPDVICFDYYPFQQHGGARTKLLDCAMWKDMGLMRKKSMETGKPFWFYFQAYNMGGDYTFTEEMRSVQMYAALAYGVKCLSYFTSLDVVCDNKGVKKDTFDEVKEINRKVQNLGDYLFEKETENLYHFGIKKANQVLFNLDKVEDSALIAGAPDGSIVGVFGDGTAKKYVLVVNKDYNNAMTGELKLREAKKVELYSHDTDKTTQVSASTDAVTLNIPAGDCALYVIG